MALTVSQWKTAIISVLVITCSSGPLLSADDTADVEAAERSPGEGESVLSTAAATPPDADGPQQRVFAFDRSVSNADWEAGGALGNVIVSEGVVRVINLVGQNSVQWDLRRDLWEDCVTSLRWTSKRCQPPTGAAVDGPGVAMNWRLPDGNAVDLRHEQTADGVWRLRLNRITPNAKPTVHVVPVDGPGGELTMRRTGDRLSVSLDGRPVEFSDSANDDGTGPVDLTIGVDVVQNVRISAGPGQSASGFVFEIEQLSFLSTGTPGGPVVPAGPLMTPRRWLAVVAVGILGFVSLVALLNARKDWDESSEADSDAPEAEPGTEGTLEVVRGDGASAP